MKVNEKNVVKNVKELFRQRGIEDLDSFEEPVDGLINPNKLDHMTEGYELLQDILKSPNPKILLIVDSDADGYTSSAVFYNYMKKHYGVECDWRIHTKKQHGLEDHIEWLVDEAERYDLVVTPDAGSNDKSLHDELWGRKQTPVLVLDHHIQDTETAQHTIIINNQESRFYDNKQLAGVGVTWQFCRYIDQIENTKDADEFIDLVALGIR